MKKFDTPLDEMLYILMKENEQPIMENLSEKDKRWLINSLMVIRTPGYVDERFIELQDAMLQKERNTYDCSQIKYKKHFALTRHDITDLTIDAILCETMDYLGNMTPNLKSLDNRLMLKGGLLIREDCNKLYIDNNYIVRQGSAFELNGHNLSSPKIVKMILPRLYDFLEYDINKIKSAVIGALDILRSHNIRNFAINVSIENIFNIPHDMYINIVTHTISSYSKENKYKFNCLLVVDNDEDENYIMQKLKLKSID